jgi:HSP20 family protein
MDRLFESFGMGGVAPRFQGGASAQGVRNLWAPHIEVCERNGKLLIQADLPGVRREDVDVQIEDDAVVIQGQRHQETERNEQGFYHSERTYGSFYRVVPLPEGIEAEQANATFRDGVLQIELPMPQQRQRGRRLEIREGGSATSQLGGAAAGTAGQHGGQSSAGARSRFVKAAGRPAPPAVHTPGRAPGRTAAPAARRRPAATPAPAAVRRTAAARPVR